MIVGVILAAGESKRMGQPKALLKIGGRTFLDHIAASLVVSKLELVYVVLGDHAELVEPALPKTVHAIYNSNYREGQLSSLKVAIEKAQYENCDGAMVTLVDHPLISPQVVERLIENFYLSRRRLIIPSHQGKRGHPVLYSREVFPEILATPTNLGANSIREANLEHTLEVEVDEPGVLIDIDTPQDYERYITRSAGSAAK